MTRVLALVCVILNLLSEDQAKPLYAFEAEVSKTLDTPSLTLSLEEAIQRVKARHPDLRLQEIAVRKAAEEVKLQTRAFLPDLDADYIASSAAGGAGLILAAARLLTPVFSLKTLVAERKIRKLLEAKEKVLLRARELEVTQEVKELYTGLLIQERLLETLRRNLKLSRERFRLKRIHHREGGLTDEELFRERLTLEEAVSLVEKASLGFRQSGFAFRSLLGVSPLIPVRLLPVGAEEERGFPLSLEECFLIAEEKNPLVEALRLMERASERERDKRKARFVVDGFFVGLGESGDLFQGRPRLGATGNLTLYDWGKKKIKDGLRSLTHETLLLKHQKELEALGRQILKDYSELLLLQREIETSSHDLRLRRESRRRERILQGAGRTRREKVLQAEEGFFEARATFFGKRLEYFIARERLLKDLGVASLAELQGVLAR